MILLDFEFTGINNEYIRDNEITQMKYIKLNDALEIEDTFIQTFATHKKITPGAFFKTRIFNSHEPEFFTAELFEKHFPQDTKEQIIMWSTKQDADILDEQYQIKLHLYGVIDLQEQMRHTKFEKDMATGAASLEAVYYMITGKLPSIYSDHGGIDEVMMMYEIFKWWRKTSALPQISLEYVPYGFCAGMPIREYCERYRRNADGYRYHNSDAFSAVLDAVIEEMDEKNKEFDPFDEN